MQFGDDKITEWRIKLEMELELSLFYCFGKRVKIFICKNKLSLLKFPAPPYRVFHYRGPAYFFGNMSLGQSKKIYDQSFYYFFLRLLENTENGMVRFDLKEQ